MITSSPASCRAVRNRSRKASEPRTREGPRLIRSHHRHPSGMPEEIVPLVGDDGTHESAFRGPAAGAIRPVLRNTPGVRLVRRLQVMTSQQLESLVLVGRMQCGPGTPEPRADGPQVDRFLKCVIAVGIRACSPRRAVAPCRAGVHVPAHDEDLVS